MSLLPTAREETATNGEDSPADGIEGNHTGEEERQDDGRRPTLPVTLDAREHDLRSAEDKRNGEERPAGLREPEPTAEPLPVASKQGHSGMLESDPPVGVSGEVSVVPQRHQVSGACLGQAVGSARRRRKSCAMNLRRALLRRATPHRGT
jgi:hypothetical protein